MKHFLVKGKECKGGNWRNFSCAYSGDSADEAVTRAKWKFRKADKVVIESVYQMIWKRTATS